jgi:hypothetical protein
LDAAPVAASELAPLAAAVVDMGKTSREMVQERVQEKLRLEKEASEERLRKERADREARLRETLLKQIAGRVSFFDCFIVVLSCCWVLVGGDLMGGIVFVLF